MNTQTLLFIGPPGSGKGTQAKLAATYLEGVSDQEVLHVQMGAHFRELSESSTCVGVAVKEAMKTGKILPPFLAISFWAARISERLTDDIHLVLDGSPRTKDEARELGAALRLCNRTPATIAYLPISEAKTYDRLSKRHRGDDKGQIVDVRLAEYQQKTVPAIEFCRQSDDYNLVEIDGEQSIEAIQSEIQNLLTND